MKHFIGGYEVSSTTRLAYDRQQERNRQAEYRAAEERRKIELIEEQTELLRKLLKGETT